MPHPQPHPLTHAAPNVVPTPDRSERVGAKSHQADLATYLAMVNTVNPIREPLKTRWMGYKIRNEKG